MADTNSFFVRASNYHMNANAQFFNITLIVTFPRHAESGISEVAIVFEDKTEDEINKLVNIAGGRVIKRMPMSFCDPIVDMVRNEKPIFVTCGFTPGNSVTSEGFAIFTHLEEVGEQER